MRPPVVRLRALERRDLPFLFRYANTPEVARHQVSFRLPTSTPDAKDFFERMRRSATDRVFSVESARGRYLGSVGLHGINWIDRCCEFGVVIASPRDWGHGYAAAAVRAGVELAFARLHLHRLEVPVLARNRVARAMYERLGFFPEGVLRDRRFFDGQYEDVVVLSLLSSDRD